jgi:5'-deoxy-5'-methylthioadenosine phosphorylase
VNANDENERGRPRGEHGSNDAAGLHGRARTADLGLIIGSGADRLDLEIVARSSTHTPYGPPSSALLTANIGGVRVLCLTRHGEAHTIAPHEVNYRANLWALWQHGVRRCIGVNAVGAIAPGFEPGHLAVPDQLIDYTWGRPSTFGGADGGVVHVDFTEPFDADLRRRLIAACRACSIGVRAGGVYGVTQGPRLETAAEIDRLERDGCAMVGMTAMPEAVLARELGMRYAVCAFAVNHAAGRLRVSAALPGDVGSAAAEGDVGSAAPQSEGVPRPLPGDAMSAPPLGGPASAAASDAPPRAAIHAEIERHLADGMRRVLAVLIRFVEARDDKPTL